MLDMTADLAAARVLSAVTGSRGFLKVVVIVSQEFESYARSLPFIPLRLQCAVVGPECLLEGVQVAEHHGLGGQPRDRLLHLPASNDSLFSHQSTHHPVGMGCTEVFASTWG